MGGVIRNTNGRAHIIDAWFSEISLNPMIASRIVPQARAGTKLMKKSLSGEEVSLMCKCNA